MKKTRVCLKSYSLLYLRFIHCTATWGGLAILREGGGEAVIDQFSSRFRYSLPQNNVHLAQRERGGREGGNEREREREREREVRGNYGVGLTLMQ